MSTSLREREPRTSKSRQFVPITSPLEEVEKNHLPLAQISLQARSCRCSFRQSVDNFCTSCLSLLLVFCSSRLGYATTSTKKRSLTMRTQREFPAWIKLLFFSLACSAQTADYERVSVLRLTRHVLLRLRIVRRVSVLKLTRHVLFRLHIVRRVSIFKLTRNVLRETGFGTQTD